MEKTTLMKAQIQAKRIYVLLTEVLDLSRQLAEALDRDDQVTARMLISMRSEPINKLSQARAALDELKNDLPTAEATRLAEILNGDEPVAEDEQVLAAQVRMNQRLLEQVIDLDKSLNLKIAREKSIYNRRTSAR